ncbi:MAG: metal-dependent hydrolase [Anaerolineae bacterium]
MKGIAHFVTGVAVATFFPEVVEGAAGGSVLPMVGGIAGILPDTLDFRLVRYFVEYDFEVDPGPEPDAPQIAEQVGEAMRRAYEGGEPRRVKLHTIQLGADLWRQYVVHFDAERKEVGVRVGPIVDTGQVLLPGSEPEPPQEARVEVGVPVIGTYDTEVEVNTFSGPSFKFVRWGDGLQIHFLDWHRRWSHSLTLAAGAGLATAAVSGLVQYLAQGSLTRTPLWAGLVVGLGLVSHVLEDQLGFLGSNLLYPFTRDRTNGLQLLRSGDAIPNFLAVWTAVMLILFNLDRFSGQPRLDPWWFLGLMVVLPVAVLGGLHQLRRRKVPGAADALRQLEILAEAEEAKIQ